MRLLTCEHDGAARAGIVVDDVVRLLDPGVTVLDLLRAGIPTAPPAGGPVVALSDVRLLSPLDPPSVRDFVAFEEHVEGVRRSVDGVSGVPDAWYDAPAFYFTNPAALVGAHDNVPLPPGCTAFDYELEVAAVVGAHGEIAAYTIFNDWSARDLQRREMTVGLGPAKGKDTVSTLGPWLVTADEMEPYRDDDGLLALGMTASVNGVETGRDLLSNMSWTFEEMAAHAARGTRLRAGDVLGSGTCGNGGCLAELWGLRGRQDPPPLRPGDVVELSVEGIGTVRNTVVDGPDAGPPVPSARRRPRARRRPASALPS